jgi:adenine-specific DNA methylase
MLLYPTIQASSQKVHFGFWLFVIGYSFFVFGFLSLQLLCVKSAMEIGMSNDDHLYLTTDLSQEEILKLFMQGTEPFPEIGTVSGTRFMKYVETECYTIECDKTLEHETEDSSNKANIIMTIMYEDYHRTEGENDIAFKAIQLVNTTTGNMVLSYKDRIALKRIDGKLKLVKALIKQEYELVDAPNVD